VCEDEETPHRRLRRHLDGRDDRHRRREVSRGDQDSGRSQVLPGVGRGGIGEKHRRRIILTRRVDILTPDPDNPNAILWNPGSTPFEEAWARLGIDGGSLAVVGGTDTFGLFLSIGYDAFYLTKTDASVPKGRPVFPGVGTTTTAEAVMGSYGLVHKGTRMLDASVNCRVEEWVRKG
jgi:hypothetical protein